MIVQNARLIEVKEVNDPRGSLSVIEGLNSVPFEIKRVYYMYNIAEGADRGHHAMKTQYKFLVAIHGSFDVILNDGINEKRFHLYRPNEGLLITDGLWREMHNFTPGAVCLVLANENFIESDHIRNFDSFLAYKNDLFSKSNDNK
jgi:hypothetical protein